MIKFTAFEYVLISIANAYVYTITYPFAKLQQIDKEKYYAN